MKKSLLIALCCITVLFAACKKEKPYEKFVGDYQGTVVINGQMESQQFPQANQEITNLEQPISFTLTPGTEDNLVVFTYTPEGQGETYTSVGTITNDVVDFEPIVYDQDVMMEDFGFPAHFYITIDFDGTLSGNQLLLSGVVDGTVSLNSQELPLPIECMISATFEGPVSKIVAE